MLNILLSFISCLLFWGDRVLAADFNIDSNPSSTEFFAVNPQTGIKTKIGRTPYKEDLDSFIQNYVKDNIFMLEFARPGYVPYRILVTKTSNVDITLNVNLVSNLDVATIQKRDQMIGELFNAQRLIRSKNFSGAMSLLDSLEKSFKEYSIISELKGTVYYLMGNPEEALSQYRLAFGKNTKNSDAYKMKEYLEKKMGVSSK